MSEVLARLHPQQLLRKGTVAAAGGDAAALLQAYARRGDALLEHVGGPFVLAALDPARGPASRRSTTPVRQASTSPPIAEGVDTTLDPQPIHDHPHFHMTPAPATTFTGLRKLQAAHRLHLARTAVQVECYWLPVFAEAPVDAGALGEETRDTLHGTAHAVHSQ